MGRAVADAGQPESTPVGEAASAGLRTRQAGWEALLSWVGPFVLYLVTRLFTASPYWKLENDQVDYLLLARSFPYHHLFNDQVYLIHPPVWGYVIGLVWHALRLFGVSLATTGLLVESVFVLAVFFVVRAYARRNGVGPAGVAVALLYLGVSTLALSTQGGISRFPILVTEVGLCLVLFERWLADPGRSGLPWAVAALTAVTLLTSDNGLVLFPGYLLIFGLHTSWAKWRGLLGLLLLSALAAAVWPSVRLGVYLAHDQFPAGMGGTVEVTHPVPWPGVLQPNLLPITAMHNATVGHTGIAGVDFRRVRDYLTRFAVPSWVPAYAVIATLVVASLSRGLRVRLTRADVNARFDPDQWRVTAKLLGLSFLTTLPILVGLYPWYAATFVIPVAVLLGRGADGLLGRPAPIRRVAVGGVTILCVVISYAWLTKAYLAKGLWADPLPGPHFLFTRVPQTPTVGLAPELAGLGMSPATDAVLMPVGLAETLTYTAGYRGMCLPLDPDALAPLVRRYGITHIILTDDSLVKPIGGPKARRYTGWETARFVDDHPDEYPLIGAPVQTYPDGTTQTFRVYKVLATARHQ